MCLKKYKININNALVQITIQTFIYACWLTYSHFGTNFVIKYIIQVHTTYLKSASIVNGIRCEYVTLLQLCEHHENLFTFQVIHSSLKLIITLNENIIVLKFSKIKSFESRQKNQPLFNDKFSFVIIFYRNRYSLNESKMLIQ